MRIYPAQIKLQTSCSIPSLVLQSMTNEEKTLYIQRTLSHSLAIKLTQIFSVEEECLEDKSVFRLSIFCSTAEEFWQCVEDQAKILAEPLD